MTLLRESMKLGFLFGVLESLWELFLPDLIAHRPINSWHAWLALKGFGVPILLFFGSLWAGIAILLAFAVSFGSFLAGQEPHQDRSRQVRRLLWAGALGLSAVAFLWHAGKLPFTAGMRRWVPIVTVSLAGGWALGGLLENVRGEMIARSPRFFRAGRWLTQISLAGIAVGWVCTIVQGTGWTLENQAQATPSPFSPNVLILTIDSLRADHMSLYGYPKKTTPAIDAFARQGAIMFRDCQAQATWTKPSVAWMMTGHFSPKNVVEHKEWGRLDPQRNTLFERLYRAGYRTSWLAANPYLAPEYGVAPPADPLLVPRLPLYLKWTLVGWGVVEGTRNKKNLRPLEKIPLALASIMDGTWHRPRWIRDDELQDTFLGWLSKLPHDKPWASYIHFMAVHSPYGDTAGYNFFPLKNSLPRFELNASALNSQKLAGHQAAYDLDIQYTDTCVGQILAVLEERGDLERTIVVITADHGEEFGEHGMTGHGEQTFHRGVTHVPLLLWIPGQQDMPKVVTHPVQHLDLVPTLLKLCGIPQDPVLGGWDLLKIAQGRKEPGDRILPHEAYSFRSQEGVTGLREGRYQLYLSQTQQKTQWALYDLEVDPAEKRNIASQHPEVVEKLLAQWKVKKEDVVGEHFESTL